MASVSAGPADPNRHPTQPHRSASPRLDNPALAQLGMGAAAIRQFEANRPWLVAQALLAMVAAGR